MLDVPCGREGGSLEKLAWWLVDKCGPLGVRAYHATDTQGRFVRLAIPATEVPFVISTLKPKHPMFAAWIANQASKVGIVESKPRPS